MKEILNDVEKLLSSLNNINLSQDNENIEIEAEDDIVPVVERDFECFQSLHKNILKN